MMKRISLKSLRISSHPKESPQVSIEDDDQGGGEYEQPHSLGFDKDDTNTGSDSPRKTADVCGGTPGTPRRKEKKGFLKTLKRKFTTNFKGRKEVASPIVDDDSSSEIDGCRGARGGYYSPRKPRARSHNRDESPSVSGRRRQPPPPTPTDVGLPHPTKEELSKSTEESSSTSPNDEDKSNFLTDTEYGHASALSGSSLQPPGTARLPSPSILGRGTHRKTCPGAHVSGDSSDNSWPEAISSQPSDSGSTLNPGLLLPSAPDLPPKSSHGSQECTEAVDPSQADFFEPKTWSLTKELFRLSKFGWYWGPITRVEAEDKLTDQPDGAFLVRDSSDERYLLSLSFRSYGRTLHTRIEHCNGVFSFYAQPETEGYGSIVDLIEHSMTDSQTGVFCYSRARAPGSPSFPVRLTKPVSRFTQVRSLQYLCRFVIRQYTRFDHIQKLPLPTSIREWLEENQY